jgi:hypothetical protein
MNFFLNFTNVVSHILVYENNIPTCSGILFHAAHRYFQQITQFISVIKMLDRKRDDV